MAAVKALALLTKRICSKQSEYCLWSCKLNFGREYIIQNIWSKIITIAGCCQKLWIQVLH
jgi:hypothetical protein